MYLLSPYHHSYNSKVLLYLSRQSTFLQILKPCSTFDISYPTWHWVTLLYCTNVFNCAYFYTSWYKMFCTGIFLWNDSYFYISDTGPNLNLSGKYISLWIRNTQICIDQSTVDIWVIIILILIFTKIKHIEYTIISIIGSRTRVLRMIIYFICHNTHMFSPSYRLGYYVIPFLTIF